MMETKTLNNLRIALGVLGLSLIPLLIWLNDGIVVRSISHTYYTSGAIAFIPIISSFAILLISYTGYEKNPWEKWSDNAITTMAGLAAATLVLVPAASGGVSGLAFTDHPYLLGYTHGDFKNAIHLVSAGVFITLLGYMSYFKFTLSRSQSTTLKTFYKACGIIVWAMVLLLAVFILLDRVFGVAFSWFPNYVFWLEAVAVWAFSLAWLRKGVKL